jgi:hypothetical protein
MLYPAELRGQVQFAHSVTTDIDKHYRLAFGAVKQRSCSRVYPGEVCSLLCRSVESCLHR